jgi:RNA polymerase sigma factor (sigma-70 family)
MIQDDEVPEAQLLNRAQSDDAKSFELSFARYYDMSHAFAFRVCLVETEADDVAQETFIRAARGIANYCGAAWFKNWLYRIAQNAVMDWGRQAAQHRARENHPSSFRATLTCQLSPHLMHHKLSLILFGCFALIPVVAQTSSIAANTNAPPAIATPPAPAVTQPPSASAQSLATAVLKFQTSDETMDKQGSEIATLLEADLSTSEHAIMVEREEMDKILSEQELGASGLVSADTAAKIGSLTGAQVLVTGRLFAVGNQYMIVAKIISTETSRVYGVTTTLNDLAALPQAAQELSGKIDGVLASHRDVLLVREETPEQRLRRLRGMIGQRPLPSVTVTITERDYTQPSIDPAAQTEIIMQLQALGFPIIDPDQNHKKADILISGEAFSELGGRHGNLVSGRGRIELKAVRTSTHELLLMDRETQIAVDFGDRTSGKEALEKAATKLVERLSPKLTK